MLLLRSGDLLLLKLGSLRHGGMLELRGRRLSLRCDGSLVNLCLEMRGALVLLCGGCLLGVSCDVVVDRAEAQIESSKIKGASERVSETSDKRSRGMNRTWRQRTLTLSKTALTSSTEAVCDRAVVVCRIHVVAHGSSVLSAIGHLVGGLLHLGKRTGLWELGVARLGRAVAVGHCRKRE